MTIQEIKIRVAEILMNAKQSFNITVTETTAAPGVLVEYTNKSAGKFYGQKPGYWFSPDHSDFQLEHRFEGMKLTLCNK